MAWWPFRWGPPTVQANQAVAAEDGWRFTPSSVVCRPVEGTLAGAEFALELRSDPVAAGETAVVLQLVDELGRVVLSLERGHLDYAVRRPVPDGTARPPLRIEVEQSIGRAHDLRIGFPDSRMQLASGDRFARSEPSSEFWSWPERTSLRIGCAAGGERPWSGEFLAGSLRFADGRREDLLDPAALRVPSWLVGLPPQLRRSLSWGLFPLDSWPDVWFNLFGFVPLGYWLARVARLRRLRTAILVAFVTSLVMEMGQLVFVPRVFSLLDLVANTLGGALGAGSVHALRWLGTRQSGASGSPWLRAVVGNLDDR